MTKLYKLIVLFLTLTVMNITVRAQDIRSSAILPVSKVFTQDIGFSNFPNPATSQTTITYKLTAKAKVILKVLDLTGRQLAVLVNAEQIAGSKEYDLDFNKNKITSGMYVLILRINNTTYSRKVIVQ